ncbi:MAG: recombinase family protein [Acidobacteriota bacterium]|nr:MAG: recombinase family protein [Acidobacteriota bacterium]
MKLETHQKVTASHLGREAYLYLRQSTVRQVFENTESTKRQYALRQRAVALGWPPERITVIDSDQGQSGASADREGFQRLVAKVGLGRAGIVLGLEVSRLARNSTDWHRLLEICALTDTLILDEDGTYDPCDFNDRLLLGLKGTMSEAELHLLRARLRGGILNKARRGELPTPLPVGFVRDAKGAVVLDPDRRVRESIRLLFRLFRRTGSACAVVRQFRQQGLPFPRRMHRGPDKGQLTWSVLRHSRVLQILHNPRYAGAFSFGRRRMRKLPGGKAYYRAVPREQWDALVRDAHRGYISWDEYEQNQKRLRDNAQAHGAERRRSPPREGPALLQGLVMCAVCGQRMTVHYHIRKDKLSPDYVCQRQGIEMSEPICQRIPGGGIDEAIGALLVETMSPAALEVALQVQEELHSRIEEADRLRRQQVQRARYEADLARRRYMQVDPANRLVADELEAEWNAKLRELTQAQQRYEQQSQADRARLSEEQRRRILALASDFPALWCDPNTPQRERKRMVRLLIEDVTLLRADAISVHVRFKGGAIRSLCLPVPPRAWKQHTTPPQVVAEIDRLLKHHTQREIAAELNKQGLTSGAGCRFSSLIVGNIIRNYDLTTRYQRLRKAGMLTKEEMARLLGVCTATIKIWARHGLLRAHRYSDKPECLYEPPGEDAPAKMQGRKLSERRRLDEVMTDRTEEVQCEA